MGFRTQKVRLNKRKKRLVSLKQKIGFLKGDLRLFQVGVSNWMDFAQKGWVVILEIDF